MFRTVPLSIIRNFSLYTQQGSMSYRFCWQLASKIGMERLTACEQDQDGTPIHPDPTRKLSAKPVWYRPLLCVQWKVPDDGQRNCPKHVEFNFKNKFEKLVHIVGFITEKCITMHGHMNVKHVHSLSHWRKQMPVGLLIFSFSTPDIMQYRMI
jgi:hypothetical protein